MKSPAGPRGELLLDNERVLVRKFIILPGEASCGPPPADRLLVFIKGGVLTAPSGRSTLWRDGRVLWQHAAEETDQVSVNTGCAPIEIVGVTLKSWAASPDAATAAGTRPAPYINYPNIPGEDLLENEWVIVQRFVVNAGQWEGVHAHVPNMLFIHIKGGHWAARARNEPEHPYPEPSPDGSVGWMPTIDISEGHESGNIGKAPIDLIWVTLKT